jgi:multiple sugar transport system substrate-binding protein
VRRGVSERLGPTGWVGLGGAGRVPAGWRAPRPYDHLTSRPPVGKGPEPAVRGCLGLVLGVLGLLSVIVVVGCGTKAAGPPTVSFLTMEYTARSATDWKELEKLFNDSHDKFQVAVTVVDWGSAHLKLANLLKDGKPPDVATVPAGWLLEWYRQGTLSPLDGVADEAFLKRFHPTAVTTGVVAGHRYGLPFGLSVRFLYINSRMLLACGLTGADGAALVPGNWDQLAQVAQAVQATPDDVREKNGLPAQAYGLGVPMSLAEAPLTFAYFLWTAGGRFFDDKGDVAFNSPEGREALTFLVTLVTSGKATEPDPLTYDLDILEALFRTEKLGMLISGQWLRGVLVEQGGRLQFGFRQLPTKAKPATLASADYVVLFTQSQKAADERAAQEERAWQFVDFIYQPETRKKFFDAKTVKDAQEGKCLIPELSASLKAMPAQKLWEEVGSSLEVAQFMPLEPAWPEVSSALATELRAAVTKQKSPEQALADAAKAAQQQVEALRAAARPAATGQ